MDDYEGDIRPPELSTWALSLLRGEPLTATAETETATANSTCFTKRHQTQTHTSKSNRFFKSLNLGQASRLNDDGVFEPLQDERKRKSSLLTPQKITSSPVCKKKDNQPIELDDNSLEVARKASVKESLNDIKIGNLWNGSGKHSENEFILDFNDMKHHKSPTLQQSIRQQRVSQPPPQQITSTAETITVNGKIYTVLEQIGKGGSSKVYKANLAKRNYAIKVVTFDNDEDELSTINELKGEIQILKKLKDCSRVIQLIDYEINLDSIKIVMECGEIDLAHVIQNKFKVNGFNEQFVRFHVNEMIQCINQVHEMGVVHSDLKPANFIFVKGTLKLIDFGISNSINGATVNVYRECQMGTPNYMAPETLIEISNDSSSIWKIGKPSDIWSIGCITYQLTYGHPPYHSYQGTKKILAITNPKITIDFPTSINNVHIPDALIQFMKRCLIRNPKLRSNCTDLINGAFISPICLSRSVLRDIVKWSVVYGGKHPEIGDGLNTRRKSNDQELNDLEKKSLIKLDTLVENLIQKVNQR